MTSLSLLDGPRGRRVCLEIAAQHDVVRSALFHARLPLDGSASTVFRIGAGPDAATRCSPDELAQAIAACGVPRFGGPELHRAVTASVDAARYWQEADGDDQLAALPIVRSALEPIARAIEASPTAAAWTRTRAPQQWAVSRVPLDVATTPSQDAAAALSDWTLSVRREEAASRARNHESPIRWTGTWWSAPPTGTSFGSPAHALDFVEDSFSEPVATLTPLRMEGRTYEVETDEDWAELCRRFPAEVTESRRHDWYRVTGRGGRWLIPDWQRVAREWDFVHLTVQAYLTAATRLIRIDDEYASVIAGWAPDSSLQLTDIESVVASPREEWTRDHDTEEWRLARVDEHERSRHG